jgi:hypothetical protein
VVDPLVKMVVRAALLPRVFISELVYSDTFGVAESEVLGRLDEEVK